MDGSDFEKHAGDQLVEVIHIIIMSYVGPYDDHHVAIWRLQVW